MMDKDTMFAEIEKAMLKDINPTTFSNDTIDINKNSFKEDIEKVKETLSKMPKCLVFCFTSCDIGGTLYGWRINKLLKCSKHEQGFIVPEKDREMFKGIYYIERSIEGFL